MPLDWNSGELAAGLSCYRKGEFFDAHEHWESVWTQLDQPEKAFLQGLIQLTVALHHYQSGNFAGARSLLQRALQRFEPYPACFGGIDIAALRSQVRNWLHALESGAQTFPADMPCIQLAGLTGLR